MQGGGADAGGGAGGGAGKGNNPFLDRDSYGIKYYSDTEAGDKIKVAAIKKRMALLEAELTKLSEALNKLREIYKKNC